MTVSFASLFGSQAIRHGAAGDDWDSFTMMKAVPGNGTSFPVKNTGSQLVAVTLATQEPGAGASKV